MDYAAYIIESNKTIRDALIALQEPKTSILTLFVKNENGEIVGSLTDGDIRRFLISATSLEEHVTMAMNTGFKFLPLDNKSSWLSLIREYRDRGVKLIPILNTHHHLEGMYDVMKHPSYLPMDAVIMAGGKGERLRPLTLTTPKPLLPVGNKAIIDHNVDRLIQYGVDHISVTTNYLAEQLESHYVQPRNEVQIQCVREPKFLGTMGAVRLVKKFHNDVVLVMNSDLFTDIDFEDMYLHFIDNKADMSIAAVPYTVSIPFGICDLDGRDVKGIVEKPTYNYYANAGIYMLRREVLNTIPENEFYNATDLIEALVHANSKVVRYPLKGTWIDIGSMSEYQKARDMVKHMN